MNPIPTNFQGLINDLPIEVYHAHTAISNSGLRNFARSPAHYYGLHRNPNRPAATDKAGQLEGTLAHCMILEPDQFLSRYAIGPDVSRATKVWKDFEASQGTKVCIKPDQFKTAAMQAESVRQITDIATLLSVGQAEVSTFWIDDTGVQCRCRPDWVHPVGDNGVILVDVKTYSDASPGEFSRQVARKGYHGQAAFYSEGYAAASGKNVLGFVFVAVETSWPHLASALMLDDEGIAKGRADNRELLARYADCNASDTWPGYSDSVGIITLPNWAL